MDWLFQVPSLVRFVISLILIYNAYSYFEGKRRERQVAALGGFPPCRTSYFMGVEIIYDFMRSYAANDVLNFWLRNFSQYGNPRNPWTIRFGGRGGNGIFTADPENIKAILATQFNDYGKGEEMHRLWYEFLGDGIFMTDGQQWHDSRKLIRPQFIKDRLSNIRVFESHAQVLLPMLGGKGETVDLSNCFFRFTLDAATHFLFGRSVDSLSQEQATFANAFDAVQRFQFQILSLDMWQVFLSRRKFRQNLKVLEDFIRPFIDKALQLSPEDLEQVMQSDTEYTFLHALAAHTRDRKVLRDQIVSVLIAGRDATACTLSWLFYELSVRPHIVKKLRREILEQVGPHRPPTYADLKNMRYLQHTMNETLRLYPVVPYNSRAALRDTTLPRGGGPDGDEPIGVLRGTMVNYSTLVMQRRADLYQGAKMLSSNSAAVASSESKKKVKTVDADVASHDEFSPERWERVIPNAWEYIPFNGGPRICIGQQFALTEMGYIVTRILQRFERIEYRGEGHPGLLAQIVLAPAQPLLVSFYAATDEL